MVPGTQVGAYRIVSQIGEGGMGSVWMAEHAMLGRRAALKVLHPMFSSQADIVTRFFNEARAATAISDPGIVQIFDFGHHTDGSAYIVMELLDGETLASRLAGARRLVVDDALRIVRQVASSLGAAHARGIVHRDLKPENIFLVRDPEVAGGERAKILDFGIAKLVGDPSVKTQASVVMGTPLYMSPEQCRGAGQVDQRSDVYALGCVLFHLVAGIPPFRAEGAGELIAMHMLEAAPRVSTRVAGVPTAVDDLIARCLEKDPGRRYTSGSDLAAALGTLVGRPSSDGLSASSGRAISALAQTVASTTLSASAGSSIHSPAVARRSRTGLVIGFGATVVVGGIATFAVVHGSSPPSPSSSPTPSASDVPPNSTASAAPSAQPVPPPAAPSPAPSPPDPSVVLSDRMKDVLSHFVAWSKAHAGAPCPDAAAIGARLDDPWGHPIRLTCTDQPADEMIGAVSAGPDGVIGTPDDVKSWQLGRDVCEIVRGSRWTTAAAPGKAAKTVAAAKSVPTSTSRPHPADPVPVAAQPKKPAAAPSDIPDVRN